MRSPATAEYLGRLYLEAEVDVVRIAISNGNGFGVGCYISDYRVLTSDAIPSWALAPAEQKVSTKAIEQLV
jgi:hypothetical protein